MLRVQFFNILFFWSLLSKRDRSCQNKENFITVIDYAIYWFKFLTLGVFLAIESWVCNKAHQCFRRFWSIRHFWRFVLILCEGIISGADPGFSRGGSRFSTNFRNFCRPFFKIDQIDFSSSPKVLFCPCFGKNFCAAGKILKKQPKKGIFRLFWKILTKNSRFFGARSPQN